MKRIGILTLDSRIYNYGGLLQEYALFKIIENSNFEVEIIDYDNYSEANTFSYKRGFKYFSLKKFIHKIELKLNIGETSSDTSLPAESKQLFDEFRKKYLTFSERCDQRDIKRICEAYDYVICGSDQIWNPAYNIPSFFLNFLSNNKGKIIYAASLGVSKLTRLQKKTYSKLLIGIKNVSVREKNAKEIIQQLTDSEVKLVLDPTLLLKKKDWIGLMNCDFCEKDYIFCYFLGMSKEKINAASKFAKKNKLKIISIPFANSEISEKEFSTYKEPVGPLEFLELIYNAKIILTDSFHACVFSIMFDRPFRVFSRSNLNTNMDGRLETLLRYINKPEYMIKPDNLDDVEIELNNSYDYSNIDKERKNSIKWLKDAIENENKST